MLDLETLKTQRELMEGNEEVCRILDKQIEELEIETERPKLEEELKEKIRLHKEKQQKAKESVRLARAALSELERTLQAELEISVREINALRSKINSVHEENNRLTIEDLFVRGGTIKISQADIERLKKRNFF